MPGRYQVLAGILAQEISHGESLLFLRKAPKLRQRAQPLFARYATTLEPEPTEDPGPGRRIRQACLRLYLLLKGVQGP